MPARGLNAKLGNALAAAVIGLGAFLLFAVQPIVGKYLLPWFGGTPGVWSTCLVFFQVLLLGGYLYAHLVGTYLSARQQKLLHLGLLALTAVMLPVNLGAREPAIESTAQPVSSILLILVQTVGLPYFVLSTTSPLIQKWYGQRNLNPYRLYALSNLGSLGALVAYPILIEPLLPRSGQTWGWSIMLWLYLAACAACTLLLAESPARRAPEAEEDVAPSPLDRTLWVVLPAIASMMLLGVSNKLCQDLAPIPLLWLMPLGLYLLSFILCFDHPRWYRPRTFLVIFPLAGAASLMAILLDPAGGVPITVHLLAFNAMLFTGCMLCHGELARRQPPAAYLTHYYLSLAGGGALGGMVVALGAPLVLRDYSEMQITLLLCLGVMAITRVGWPRSDRSGVARLMRGYVCGWLGFLAVMGWASMEIGSLKGKHYRNFYGVVSVVQRQRGADTLRLLQHGQITHGIEFLTGPFTNQANTYYGIHSGIGKALLDFPPEKPKKVGVLGLGIGCLGVYAQPHDTWTYYEINPTIIELAQTHFGELKKYPCHREILAGDARQRLAQQPPQNFDCLIVDVFSGDAIPTHLLTREAFVLYLRHLKPGGVLAIHISNRHLDLEPVVRKLAEAFGLEVTLTNTKDRDLTSNETRSVWVTLREKPGMSRSLQAGRMWTDDYTAILPIVRWRGRE